MQVSITLKNQEDAGDDNFKQTYYYAKETRNYSVYLFKIDDIQKLFNYLLGDNRKAMILKDAAEYKSR